MIRRSRAIALAALGLSAALHAGGLSAVREREEAQIAGGAPTSVARLGNSFQDVAAGVTTAEVAEEFTETPEPPVLETETALNRAIRPEIPVMEPPSPPQAAVPEQPTQAEIAPAEMARPVPVAPSAPPPPPSRVEAEAPDLLALDIPKSVLPDAPTLIASLPAKPAPTLAPQTPVLTAQPVRPQETVRPKPLDVAKPEPLAEPTPPQIIEALPQPDDEAVQVSRRPPPRPERIKTRKTVQAAPKPKPQPRGTAAQNQVRGEVEGQKQATANQSSNRQAARAAAAGNAAVTNYPGQVMRRITRLRRPSTRSRGTATIAFTVSASGGLASARVARSSGAADLDNAALTLVRRAAPFPPPPPGARRSFQIGIKGR